MGVELRQFGERTVRRRAADRPAVGVGAMRQDRDQPAMRQPAGGQQLLLEFWIELDGGMEASTPRTDVDGAVGIRPKIGAKRPGASLSATASAL